MFSKSQAKYIQSLHHKKFRDAEAAFIAEGTKVVPELLASGKFECTFLIGLKEWFVENEITVRKQYKGDFWEVKDFELEKLSALSTPNKVLAVFKQLPAPQVSIKDNVSLMLDAVQDPGNLGTIIRIADWFGIKNIICSEDTVEQYNPKVVQSTMGSLGRVNVLYTNLESYIEKNAHISTYAAALDGKGIDSLKGLKEGIIIIGNESKGIRSHLMKLAKQKITIPKKGEAESLNAAIATGIILSHL